MDLPIIVAALLLPWMLGVALLAALRDPARAPAGAGEFAWQAGAGWFVGAFALTLWMRALSFAGLRFGVAAVALPLIALASALLFVAWRRDGRRLVAAKLAALSALVASPGLAGAARVAWWAVIAWLALRFALLALEVTWRPLYPWDAWIQWATKARVWYEYGTLVPFARAGDWFAAGGTLFFDASPEYPPTVPLWQVWIEPGARPLRRRPDQRAVVDDRGDADDRRLRRGAPARPPAADGACGHGAGRDAAARQRPRRARRLRRPAARRVLHRRRAGVRPVGGRGGRRERARLARRRARAAAAPRLHPDQESRPGLGPDRGARTSPWRCRRVTV